MFYNCLNNFRKLLSIYLNILLMLSNEITSFVFISNYNKNLFGWLSVCVSSNIDKTNKFCF